MKFYASVTGIAIALAAVLLIFLSEFIQTIECGEIGNVSSAETARDAKLSLTVFPVSIEPGKTMSLEFRTQVATVIGSLLQRADLKNVELAEHEFVPPASDDAGNIAAAFTEHIVKNPPDTQYALFAQLVGTPQTGPKAIVTILVDRSGKVLLAERDTPETFSKIKTMRPKDPMTCSIFVARRIAEFWKLPDPLRPGAPTDGTMTALLAKHATRPPQAEIDAMSKRLDAMKKNLAEHSVSVYPVRLATGTAPDCTKNLVAAINSQGLFKAVAAAVDPAVKIEGNFDEQRVLWSTARSFQQFIRKNPPPSAYALYAVYGICGPDVKTAAGVKREATAVHLILCDRAGEWVMVDYQNSHHPDFQKIHPKTCDECNRLALIRLAARLSE